MKKLIFIIALLLWSPLFAEEFSILELQDILVKENPRLKSMEYELEMMKRRIPVASALEDPKVKIGINSLPIDSWSFKDEDMTSKEIGISQMFPLGGKLGIKEAIARKEFEKAKERLRKERVEMLHMLRMNIYDYFYIKTYLKILEEMKEYVKLLVDSEASAVKAGKGSIANVLKANTELSMIDEEVISLKQKETEVKKKIAYLTGVVDSGLNIKVKESFKTPFRDIKLDEIKEKIVQQNPDLRLLSIDREISKDEVTLKEKEYYPDLEIGISYMQRDNSKSGMKRPDMVSAMAVFNIPLWKEKKNLPMIEEMRNKEHMVESLIRDKENELIVKAETLLSQLKKWEELYKLYNEQLIPQNELTFEAIIARYKTGEAEFMPVVDTIRMLLRYKKEVAMIQKEYLSTISELKALMGEEITK